MTETMMQAFFLSLLYLVGLAFNSQFRNSFDIITIGILSFPVGAALWVITSVIILVLGIPFTPVTMLTLSLLWILSAGYYLPVWSSAKKKSFPNRT